MAPMLRNKTWRKLAQEFETLCFKCMLDRAIERQVDLDCTDLRPCPFNLQGWPQSYFNMFFHDQKHIERSTRKQWRVEAWKGRHLNMFPARVWIEI